MAKYKKYKNFLEKFLDSNRGKRIFNIIYSVGAAIVIIGAMAKILHWPMGNEMLMIGMITEAIVFLISAFEKPDKDYKWEEVYPVLADSDEFVPKAERIVEPQQESVNATQGPAIQSTSIPSSARKTTATSSQPIVNTGNAGGNTSGTVIIGGGDNGNTSGNQTIGGSNTATNNGSGGSLPGNITIVSGSSSSGGNGFSGVPEEGVEYLAKMADNMDKFAKATEALMQVSESLQKSFSTITDNADGIGNNTQNYITQMESLNRNIAGLNTIYEVQLKGISGQIHTIEHINAGLDRIKKLYDGSLGDSSIFKNETEKMAKQLSELNNVYSRLLQAMTSNMNMGGGFGNSNLGNTPSQP